MKVNTDAQVQTHCPPAEALHRLAGRVDAGWSPWPLGLRELAHILGNLTETQTFYGTPGLFMLVPLFHFLQKDT